MVDLLKIKLFVPHTGGILVSRPRLVELLNSRLDKELILIAAPAEFVADDAMQDHGRTRSAHGSEFDILEGISRLGSAHGRSIRIGDQDDLVEICSGVGLLLGSQLNLTA